MEKYEAFGFVRSYMGAQIVVTRTREERFRARIKSEVVELEVTSRLPFRSADEAATWAERIAEAIALHPEAHQNLSPQHNEATGEFVAVTE